MQPMYPIRKGQIAALVKYQERGYTFKEGREHDPTFDSTEPERFRLWSDEYTLRLGFVGRTITNIENAPCWKLSHRVYGGHAGWFDEYCAYCLVRERSETLPVLYANWYFPTPHRPGQLLAISV